MPHILETARLRLREFTLSDTNFIIELVNSPGWLQFIGDKNIKTAEQATAYLENGPLESYRQNGFGLSLVERREDGEAIGMCGIIKRDSLENPDIGFAFLPGYYRNGYAYEIASATLDYAQNQLALHKIAPITLPTNLRSIKLLEKLGLSFVKTIILPGSKEKLLLYSN
ncbi:GNAT family N-acetyltransferase [uncultured Pontibacter sp.]|uniref:GNAT family N-acetyltransferase n=1 Tax=uncultured Pontibacter sp. TaxID=453356 RepID=UPI00261070CA|nr:GNAT family N-acetyltransferase [uncultured Pontibacter sp.]